MRRWKDRRVSINDLDFGKQNTQRFFGYVEEEKSGCWKWVGLTTFGTHGRYGNFTVKGVGYGAHRFSFVYFINRIKDGYQIDHLCRNTLCVNPFHLEQVTARENVMRSNSPTAINARKTHCKKGHPLSGDNLVRYYLRNGGRICRVCHNKRQLIQNKKRSIRVISGSKSDPNKGD